MNNKIKQLLIIVLIFISISMISYTLLTINEYFIIEKYKNSYVTYFNFQELFFNPSLKIIIMSSIMSLLFLKTLSLLKKNKKYLINQSSTLETINQERINAQARFEKFIELLPEGLYETDLFGNITFATDNLTKMMGFNSSKDAIGVNVFSIMKDEKNIKSAKESFKKRIENNLIGTMEYEVIKIDGVKTTIIIQASPLLNNVGEIIGTRGVVLDSSEISKLRKDYKEQYKLLKLIIDTIPLPLYLQNMKGEYTNFNNAFIDFVNKKHEDEVREKTVFNLFPHDISRSLYKKSVDLMRSNDISQQFQQTINNKDSVIIQTKFINDDDTKHGGIIGIIQDLSLINSIKNELENSEETFKVLTENSVVGVGVLTNGNISYMNDRMSNIIGYKRNEIILTELFSNNIIHERDQNKFKKIINVINKQNHVKGNLRLRSQSGLIKYVEIELKKVDYESGQSILVTIIDITPYIQSLRKDEAKLEKVDWEKHN